MSDNRVWCCVPQCNSLRKDILLHRFPSNSENRKQWLKFVECENNDVGKLFVCHKHFENKFVNTSTNRLKSCAYPSLFTELEISTGKSNCFSTGTVETIGTERGYSRKYHIDHSYALKTDQTIDQVSRSEDADDAVPVQPTNSSNINSDDTDPVQPATLSYYINLDETGSVQLTASSYSINSDETGPVQPSTSRDINSDDTDSVQPSTSSYINSDDAVPVQPLTSINYINLYDNGPVQLTASSYSINSDETRPVQPSTSSYSINSDETRPVQPSTSSYYINSDETRPVQPSTSSYYINSDETGPVQPSSYINSDDTDSVQPSTSSDINSDDAIPVQPSTSSYYINSDDTGPLQPSISSYYINSDETHPVQPLTSSYINSDDAIPVQPSTSSYYINSDENDPVQPSTSIYYINSDDNGPVQLTTASDIYSDDTDPVQTSTLSDQSVATSLSLPMSPDRQIDITSDLLKTPKKIKRKRLIRNVKTLSPQCQLLYQEYRKARLHANYVLRRKNTLKFRKEQLFEEMTKNMNSISKKILLMQIKLSTINKSARRFTLEEKLIALSIYKQGPKCYKFLQKILILPSKTTLKNMINQADKQ